MDELAQHAHVEVRSWTAQKRARLEARRG